MTITPAELLSIAGKNPWPSSVDAWEELMLAADGASAALLYGVVPGLAAGWAGTAHQLYKNSLNADGSGLIKTTEQLKRVRSALQTFGSTIEGCANDLESVIQQAQTAGLTVDLETGQVGVLQTPHGYTFEPARLEQASQEITDIMQRANTADNDVAQELRTFLPSGLPQPPPQYATDQETEAGVLSASFDENPITDESGQLIPVSPYTAAQQEELVKDPAAAATMWAPPGSGLPAKITSAPAVVAALEQAAQKMAAPSRAPASPQPSPSPPSPPPPLPPPPPPPPLELI